MIDDLQPTPPTIAHLDGSSVLVRIAGTIPDPTLHAVDSVEVEQEGWCSPVVSLPPDSVEPLRLDRRGLQERVRVRWVRHGVPGPWSKWAQAVSAAAAGAGDQLTFWGFLA